MGSGPHEFVGWPNDCGRVAQAIKVSSTFGLTAHSEKNVNRKELENRVDGVEESKDSRRQASPQLS